MVLRGPDLPFQSAQVSFEPLNEALRVRDLPLDVAQFLLALSNTRGHVVHLKVENGTRYSYPSSRIPVFTSPHLPKFGFFPGTGSQVGVLLIDLLDDVVHVQVALVVFAKDHSVVPDKRLELFDLLRGETAVVKKETCVTSRARRVSAPLQTTGRGAPSLCSVPPGPERLPLTQSVLHPLPV